MFHLAGATRTVGADQDGHTMRNAASRWNALCLTPLLLLLCGCSGIMIKLGARVDLAKLPVTSMEASLPQGSAIAPGESSPLVLTFTQPGGKVLTTSGAGKGKVLWRDIAVTPAVVTVNKKGVLNLAHDPRLSDGKTGHVDISVPSHPDLHASLDIPLTYAYPFFSRYAGASGSSGSNGTAGIDGLSGSSGSMDPDNPSAGGNGGNGTNGGDGSDGGDGGDGPNVTVRAALRPGTHPLLQIQVTAAGHHDRYYLVDPQGGSLTVTSTGGAGGSGGKGGSGGRGGSGGLGIPMGSSGSDGSSGHDGSNGRSGSDGAVTVLYDPQVTPFLTAIRASNGAVFTQTPVAPMW